MNLSMSLLADYLAGYQPEIHISNDTRSIKGFRFLTDQIAQSTLDYVYIGTADRYFQDSNLSGGWILASGQNHLLCREADYEELLNDVLSAFDYYNELEQQLILSAAQHRSADELIKILMPSVRSPLILFDLEGNVIAAADPEKVADPRLRANLLEARQLGTNIISSTFVDRNGEVSHDLTDDPQLLHPADRPSEECVCQYVSQGAEHLGFILCFPTGIRETLPCMALVPLLAGYLKDCREFQAADSLFQSESSVFIRLLNGEDLLPSVLHRFEKQLGFSGYMVIFLVRSLAIRNYTLRHMLINDLRLSGLQVLVCEFSDMTAVLTSEKDTDQVIRVTRSRAFSENITIGISMPILHPDQIPAACQQALFALQSSPEAGIRRCRDLALDYLLHTLSDNKMTGYLLHPALPVLESYDNENQSELLPTLCRFARDGFSQAETAKQLHIHLNTLKYRLKRISNLTGVTFHDQRENFYIQLSAALYLHLSCS